MKSILLTTACLISLASSAQTFEELDLNNIRAGFNANGELFHNTITSTRAFEVPKDSGIHSFYSGGLMIGGIKATGQLVLDGKIQSEKHTIDLTSLTAGMYFLQVQNGNQIGSKKLINR